MTQIHQSCRCVTFHTYSAQVTLSAWNVVTHVCQCGRVHFEETIPVTPKATRHARSNDRRQFARPGKSRQT